MKKVFSLFMAIVMLFTLTAGIDFSADASNAEHEHMWNSGEITLEPTCTKDGVKTFACQTCEEAYEELIPAIGHDCIITFAQEATCVESGCKLYLCKNCGAEFNEIIPLTDCTWSSGLIRNEPTCTAPGSKMFTCIYCSDTKIESIPALGHSYTKAIVNPTCTEKGYTLYTCANCGEMYIENYVPSTGHSFGNNDPKCSICSALNPDYIAPTLPSNDDDAIELPDIDQTTQPTTKPAGTTKPTQPTAKPTEKLTNPQTTNPVTEPTTVPTTQPIEQTTQIPALTEKPSVPVTHPSTTVPSTTQNTTTVKVTQKETTTAKEKPPVKGVKKVSGEWVNKKQKNASVKKLKKAKKSLKVYWKRVSGVKGYQIQYSTSKKFTKKTTKKVTVKGNKATSKTIKKLKGGKKYYVRVRTYKTYKVNKKTVNVYSKWSKAKAVTIKK